MTSRLRQWCLVAGWVGLAACTSADQKVEFELSKDAIPDLGDLPQSLSGNPLLFAVPGLRVEVDETRRNPITAVGGCATWVMSCFEPSTRSLVDCVRAVPDCATDEPWNETEFCCPTACKEAFTALRSENVAPYEAFDQVLFQDRSCVPGLVELMKGAQ